MYTLKSYCWNNFIIAIKCIYIKVEKTKKYWFIQNQNDMKLIYT